MRIALARRSWPFIERTAFGIAAPDDHASTWFGQRPG